MSTNIEILGIGNPFIDLIVEIEESFLHEIGGSKGGMVSVDYQTLCEMISKTGNVPVMVLGGSGANTIRGLAQLGHSSGLVGKLGRDLPGAQFLKRLKELGVTSYLVQSDTPTAQALCLVTPDSQRTMRSFFGASAEITIKDLNPAIFNGVKLVHLEGYSILHGDLAEEVMRLAKSVGAKISLDLGSFEIVKAYKERILHLICHYVDLLFANIDETLHLTGLPAEQGCESLRQICPTVVVLMGEEGCCVGTAEKMARYPAIPVKAIDTTGAGDLFASGFLHGYLKGMPVEDSAYYGAIIASSVVQVKGVELSNQSWIQIRDRLANHGR